MRGYDFREGQDPFTGGDRYSMTSSARASSVGGMATPSVLAVFEVDDKPIFGRRLHRQAARLRTLEDAIDVTGSIPRKVNCFRKTTFEVQGLLLDLCFAQ
jgi:hypothetical protein